MTFRWAGPGVLQLRDGDGKFVRFVVVGDEVTAETVGGSERLAQFVDDGVVVTGEFVKDRATLLVSWKGPEIVEKTPSADELAVAEHFAREGNFEFSETRASKQPKGRPI